MYQEKNFERFCASPYPKLLLIWLALVSVLPYKAAVKCSLDMTYPYVLYCVMLPKVFHSLFIFSDTGNSSFCLIDMPSKLRLAHLKNARLVWVEHLKKQKLERSQLTNTEQLRVDDDQLCISDTSDMSHTEDGEGQKVSGSGMRAQTNGFRLGLWWKI